LKTGILRGKVLLREGNWMPPCPSGTLTPLATKVLVFSPPISINECEDASPATGIGMLVGVFYKGSQQPLKVVQTNAQGEFVIRLKPGKYSVFVEYLGRPYINSFDGQGKAGVVEIKKGQDCQRDLIVNRATD